MSLVYVMSVAEVLVTVDSETLTGAVIGNSYIMLIVKDENAADLLASDNLLYIDQKTAESESLTFEFVPREEYNGYNVIFNGADLGDEVITPPAHEHNYTAEITPATCTEDGYATYTCSECGDNYTETIPATGHKSETVKGKAATCTETGLTNGAKCSVCSAILTAQTEIPATGHTPGEWEVITPAEIGKEGLEQQKCTVCGEVINERTIPAIENPVMLGDVNNDGIITAADARLALRISAQLENPSNEQLIAADVNRDNVVTAADARKILRVSASIDVL